MMTEEQYIKERLEDQINWYDGKSMSSQNMYKRLRNTEIIISTLLTFFAGLITKNHYFTYVVGTLGVVITIIAGILSLNKFHENWIEYRSICETLRHEKYMFLTSTGVYAVDNSFSILVERVETIISHENVNWAQLNSIKGEKKDE